MAISEERLIDRIQKLLNQSEDLSITEDEKKAFEDKAMEMMAKHSIDRAMLEAAKSVPETETDYTETFWAPYAGRKADLFARVAEVFNCSAVYLPGNRVRIFGFTSDIEEARTLYTVLQLHGSSSLMRTTVPVSEHGKAFRNSWWHGYVSEISRRLKILHAKEVDNTPGSAIVLRDRKTASNAAMHAAYPKLGVRHSSYHINSGYSQGRAAGSNADIGNTRLGGNRRSIGSGV